MKMIFKLFLFVLLGAALQNVGYASPNVTEEKAALENDVGDFETLSDSFNFPTVKNFFKWGKGDTAKTCKDTVIFANADFEEQRLEAFDGVSSIQGLNYRQSQFYRMFYKNYWVSQRETLNKRNLKNDVPKFHRKKWIWC